MGDNYPQLEVKHGSQSHTRCPYLGTWHIFQFVFFGSPSVVHACGTCSLQYPAALSTSSQMDAYVALKKAQANPN